MTWNESQSDRGQGWREREAKDWDRGEKWVLLLLWLRYWPDASSFSDLSHWTSPWRAFAVVSTSSWLLFLIPCTIVSAGGKRKKEMGCPPFPHPGWISCKSLPWVPCPDLGCECLQVVSVPVSVCGCSLTAFFKVLLLLLLFSNIFLSFFLWLWHEGSSVLAVACGI